MNKQLFPSALRELRADFAHRNVLIALIATGLVLGLSGPFDTFRLLGFAPRTLYWTAIVFTTFSVGSVVSHMTRKLSADFAFPFQVILGALSVGTAVTCVLIVLNLIAFRILPDTLWGLLAQWGVVTAISTVIEVSSRLVVGPSPVTPPPILDRLPFAKRGALVALSAEDHYVKVQTTKGTEMLLMRLSDAIKEVGQTEGFQVHRSHWVARDQIADVRRINDRGEIALKSGETRPISRGYMKAVRDAGLLPLGRNG